MGFLITKATTVSRVGLGSHSILLDKTDVRTVFHCQSVFLDQNLITNSWNESI